MKTIYLFLTALALTACNKAPTDVVPADPTVTPAPSAINAPAAPEAQAPQILTIAPFKTDNCTPRGYTAEVSWSIPAEQPHVNVEVRVNKVDGGLMAFKSARKASAKTGNWVKPGTQFFLVDRDSRETVAQATAGEYDCQ